ncbi:hypothetical protein DDB_G0288721 [Dictyostelium discoideum AX4]|uniref:Uncharacterized protein n=1 Tax=Dictyostelium discoideum TaxID=44689 RepID=Q54II9_DICDI|nr:hypothetical protein DDB_G0288721 [Dictyostelium discoideum AX4]EAL63092.1 hypothetical protein DDB_G0288721 [Dictyostelium discoideum AX4]|eukprot:XP_636597.1 hypothetical protein DDB_G0288721 [Dictyostelium discoideum AX4]
MDLKFFFKYLHFIDQIKNLYKNPSKFNNLSIFDFMSIFSLSIASTPIS